MDEKKVCQIHQNGLSGMQKKQLTTKCQHFIDNLKQIVSYKFTFWRF